MNGTENNHHTYLGQELQKELGLNWHSYKWRNADPALGRFFNSDPIAEDYYYQTNYQFASNNPIWKIELEGLEGVTVNGGTDLQDDNTTYLQGYNKAVRTFNKNFNDGIHSLVTDPINTVGGLINNTVLGVAQFAHDVVPGLSNVTGIENKTGNAMVTAGETVADLPNMSKAEIGSVVTGAALVIGEILATKKSPIKTTSRAARREAMRKEGIPTSQQPLSQSKNASGREYTYETPKAGGGTQTKSVQQQTMDRSHKGQPHWEAGKVKTDNGKVRTNNYGRPKLQNNKSKVDYDN